MTGIHFSVGLAIQPQSSTIRTSGKCYSTVCPRKRLYATWCAKAPMWVLKHSHATVGINQFARCAAQVAIPWTDPTRAVGNQYGIFTCVWPNPAVHTTQRDTYNVYQHIKNNGTYVFKPHIYINMETYWYHTQTKFIGQPYNVYEIHMTNRWTIQCHIQTKSIGNTYNIYEIHMKFIES